CCLHSLRYHRDLRSFPTRRSSDLDFTSVEHVLHTYLDRRRSAERPRRAAIAIAAPIVGDDVSMVNRGWRFRRTALAQTLGVAERSEEHTSELQSRENLVCRLLLGK